MIITKTKSINEMRNIIKFETTLDSGIKYLGKYTFFINEDAPVSDRNDILVVVEKNSNKILPEIIYNAKFSIFLENNAENMIVKTIICKSGLIRLHKIPNTEPLYLFLMSLPTINDRRYLYW